MYTSHPILSDWILEDIRREQEAAIARQLQDRLLRQSAPKTSPFGALSRLLAGRNEDRTPVTTLCSNETA